MSIVWFSVRVITVILTIIQPIVIANAVAIKIVIGSRGFYHSLVMIVKHFKVYNWKVPINAINVASDYPNNFIQ